MLMQDQQNAKKKRRHKKTNYTYRGMWSSYALVKLLFHTLTEIAWNALKHMQQYENVPKSVQN